MLAAQAAQLLLLLARVSVAALSLVQLRLFTPEPERLAGHAQILGNLAMGFPTGPGQASGLARNSVGYGGLLFAIGIPPWRPSPQAYWSRPYQVNSSVSPANDVISGGSLLRILGPLQVARRHKHGATVSYRHHMRSNLSSHH